ncbi:MAG: 16S rRNA (cytosine(1402)-N(4))-methyltransferase, partial [Lentisphaeria bacterium]|nr:16S rRNA (cytosine(1402)-N(4))-methyltransferase [Lentisphaeria bacterium]
MSNTAGEWVHIPVLAREVVEHLSAVAPLKRMIDGTLGNGGHTGLMLEK